MIGLAASRRPKVWKPVIFKPGLSTENCTPLQAFLRCDITTRLPKLWILH